MLTESAFDAFGKIAVQTNGGSIDTSSTGIRTG
jgi:hypothetical protein